MTDHLITTKRSAAASLACARPQFQVIALIGRLTRDPETRTTNGGDTTISKLRVAIDRGGREGADFVDVAAFGRLAGVCEEYLSKGLRVGVTGRLRHSEWTDTDGARRQSLGVVATTIEFLSPKPSSWRDEIPEPADEQPVAVGAHTTSRSELPPLGPSWTPHPGRAQELRDSRVRSVAGVRAIGDPLRSR